MPRDIPWQSASQFCLLAALILSGAVLCAPSAAATDSRQAIKIVVLAMYEKGQITGDEPGELQFWVERLPLDQRQPFPLGEHDLYLNDKGVMATVLGGGIPNATASVMALGLDQRFDLSRAYWLIAGVAGGDPEDVSLGSAVWARHVVDGDLLYEIDAREIPEHWPYGLIPLGASEPAQKPADIYTNWTLDTIAFHLNPDLVDWAWSITRNISLADAPGIAARRKMYRGYPIARKAPFVTRGDTLSASTYWHGALLNRWANDWLPLYAGEEANFVTSNMEDSGTMTALHRLAKRQLVDLDRVLVLRTVSNYTLPPPGKSAAWSRTVSYPDNGVPALESAYVVGNTVVQALLAGWSQYQRDIPAAAIAE